MTQETFSPVAQACIRIYRKQQNILVFEDFLLSDAYGMTSWIPLYVDGKNPVEYLVDIRIGNFRNLQQKVILYANERSCLLTLMRTNTQKGNTHQVTKDCLCFAHDPPVSCFPAGVFQPVISKLMHLLSEKMNPTSSDEQLEASIMKLLSLQEQDSTTDEGSKAATATYCFYPDLLAKAVHYFNAYSNQKNPITALSDEQKKTYRLQFQQQYHIISSFHQALPIIAEQNGQWNHDSMEALLAFHRYWHLPCMDHLTPFTIQWAYELAFTIMQHTAGSLPLFTPLSIATTEQLNTLTEKLNILHAYYPTIPYCAMENAQTTRQAIKSFQRLLGLPVNGILDETQWQLIKQMCKELEVYEKAISP